MARRSFLRSIVSSLGAVVVYGGWALGANLHHGWAAALRATLAQALFSAAATFLVTQMMEALFARLEKRRFGAALTIVITVAICQVAVTALHLAAGTPELLITVAPGAVVCAIFVTAYVLGLRRRPAADASI